jgi:hypothetical protein
MNTFSMVLEAEKLLFCPPLLKVTYDTGLSEGTLSMTDVSTNLALPYLLASQADKHVTFNACVSQLDTLVQSAFQSRTIVAQPSTPGDGLSWIVPAGKSGAFWANLPNFSVATFRDGAWSSFVPKLGTRAWIVDEARFVIWNGVAWEVIAGDRVQKTGDTMTGTLNLPAAGLKVGTSGLVVTSGGVGIGTPTPIRLLHLSQVGSPEFVVQETGAATDKKNFRLYYTGGYFIFGTLNDATTSGTNLLAINTNNASIIPGADNAQSLGAASSRWSVIYAATGVINTSDERSKKAVTACPLGLKFLLSLRPVAYQWRVGSSVVRPGQVSKGLACNDLKRVGGKRTHVGFLAQEVRDVIPDDIDWAGWTMADPNDQTSLQGLRYDQFVAPIVTAIQELNARIDALAAINSPK